MRLRNAKTYGEAVFSSKQFGRITVSLEDDGTMDTVFHVEAAYVFRSSEIRHKDRQARYDGEAFERGESGMLLD